MVEKSNSNFKSALKGTTLLGGVQVFKILLAIIRSKIVAVFLGPAGVGVLGLFNSALDLIYGFSNLGLGTSAIREIAAASNRGEEQQLAKTVRVVKNLVLVTGLIGMSICLFFSPYWSYTSFGNRDYSFTFALLSITVLFRLLSEGQNTILQGTRKLKFLAKSNIWGNFWGLVASVPLYYYFGVGGIAPALIITYLINLLLSWHFSNKVKIEKIKVSFIEAINKGRLMIKLGVFVSLSGVVSYVVAYVIRIYISNVGGLDDVGLYSAGFSLVETYVGMVFTAMATEYFPRLSSLRDASEDYSICIKQQMELSLLIIAPLICSFLIFSKVGIYILYTENFLGIETMICWAIFAILFKTPSWCCSYAIIAKGDSIVFFFTEILALVVKLVSSILFYKWWDLAGLGLSYLISYIYYSIQEYLVCYYRYNIRIGIGIIKFYLPHILISISALVSVFSGNTYIRYICGSTMILASFYYSYIQLNKRVGISSYIKSKFKK